MSFAPTLAGIQNWINHTPRGHVRINADRNEAQFFIGGLRRFSLNLDTGARREGIGRA